MLAWDGSYSPDNSLCEVTRTGPIHSKPNQHKDHPFNTKDIQCCYICPTAFVYTLSQDSNFPRSIQISALHLNLKQDTHQFSAVNPPIFVIFAALRTLRQTMSHHPFHPVPFPLTFHGHFFFLFYFIFKFYKIVLVLPNITMNPPQVYTCSSSWTSSLLPPHTISLGHPSALTPSIQHCASNLDWQLISYMILYMFQCHSPKSFDTLSLPQSPSECFIHQCLFCCLVHRVIVAIFLNSIYMR